MIVLHFYSWLMSSTRSLMKTVSHGRQFKKKKKKKCIALVAVTPMTSPQWRVNDVSSTHRSRIRFDGSRVWYTLCYESRNRDRSWSPERERERERENVIETKPRESELVPKHQSSGDRNGKAPANDAPWTAINSSLHDVYLKKRIAKMSMPRNELTTDRC